MTNDYRSNRQTIIRDWSGHAKAQRAFQNRMAIAAGLIGGGIGFVLGALSVAGFVAVLTH